MRLKNRKEVECKNVSGNVSRIDRQGGIGTEKGWKLLSNKENLSSMKQRMILCDMVRSLHFDLELEPSSKVKTEKHSVEKAQTQYRK